MVMHGATYETQTPLGSTFITINTDKDGNPFEVFINAGKSGSDVMSMAEALGRVVSLVLRMQGPVDSREKMKKIIAQLSGIGGARAVGFGPNRVRSLPDAVAKILADHFEFKVNGRVVDVKKSPENADGIKTEENHTNGNGKMHLNGNSIKPVNADGLVSVMTTQPLPLEAEGPKTNDSFDICPECGTSGLVHEEGCTKCYSCGYSAC